MILVPTYQFKNSVPTGIIPNNQYRTGIFGTVPTFHEYRDRYRFATVLIPIGNWW
ncbi:hypothetical protein HanXRQr2_Chr16g0745591 [Helianthus annuus]|uniref:Uncharacterized protein n=1 Tax=Helianthus annuus TaxID=4232 RepID=A0A9K3GYH1_HELAN|nr:hypothetical protein HanXRQr2_Chr16g0745591 [Helianthus annuus]